MRKISKIEPKAAAIKHKKKVAAYAAVLDCKLAEVVAVDHIEDMGLYINSIAALPPC